MPKNTMDDYSRLTAVITVDCLEFDQNSPFGPFTWDGHTWRTERRADMATTTHTTVHGRSTDVWYRLHPYGFDRRRPVWRSMSGGSLAPEYIARALAACTA